MPLNERIPLIFSEILPSFTRKILGWPSFKVIQRFQFHVIATNRKIITFYIIFLGLCLTFRQQLMSYGDGNYIIYQRAITTYHVAIFALRRQLQDPWFQKRHLNPCPPIGYRKNMLNSAEHDINPAHKC